MTTAPGSEAVPVPQSIDSGQVKGQERRPAVGGRSADESVAVGPDGLHQPSKEGLLAHRLAYEPDPLHERCPLIWRPVLAPAQVADE